MTPKRSDEEEPKTKPDNEVFSIAEKELFEKRILVFNDEVTPETIKILMAKIRALDNKNNNEITIYLNTDGGEVYGALALYDLCHTIKSPVNIHVDGTAFSSGLFIISCCATKNRTASQNSSFMYHPTYAETEGSSEDILSDAMETKRISKVMDSLVVKHSNITKTQFKKLFNKNTWFDAKQALSWGIIDNITRYSTKLKNEE